MGAIKVRIVFSIFIMVVLLFSMTTAEFYDKSELAEKSAVCLDCHEEQAASLTNSPHHIFSNTEMTSTLTAGCIGCHDNWKEHIEDPSVENIGRPAETVPSIQVEICARCHLSAHQSAMADHDPHGRAQIGCLSCHRIHNNSNGMLVADDRDNYCLVCHTAIGMEFKRRSVHPLESGNVRCTDCHNPAGIEDASLAVGLNWRCQECHAEQSGPFLHEHPVVNDHLIDGGGCVECHQPHGSANDRLLRQPGQGICLQCHEIPIEHRTRHGGRGINYPCADCHNQIHGSYDSGKFLDPMLGTRLIEDCYQSGCHNLND